MTRHVEAHSIPIAGPRCALACGLVLSALALPRLAHAQTEPSATVDVIQPASSQKVNETEAADEPSSAAEPQYHALRAALELGTVFLLGEAYYVTTSTVVPNWQLDYNWQTFHDKITGAAFGPDINRFGTNFIGHPLGGSGYYLSIRSNNGSVLRATGAAFLGSFLWEMFGEISSIVSLNDSIVTPLAGIAIGESTFQLGSYFDRAPRTFTNRALGVLFGPFKSFNDLLDGAAAEGEAGGLPQREEHRFDLGAAYAAVFPSAERAEYSTLRLRLGERIAHFAPFDDQGQLSEWFHEGNASGMGLDLGLGARGVDQLRLDTRAVLVGLAFRDVRYRRGGPVGGGGVMGLGVGFQYGIHDYRRAEPGSKDYIAAVRPLEWVLSHRVRRGGFTLDSYVEAGPAFGGVRSFALDGLAGSPERLPEPSVLPQVTQLEGYYFGLGGAGQASLALAWRGLELAGRMQFQAFGAPDTPGEKLHCHLSDTERVLEQTLSWTPAPAAVRLQLFAEQRSRSGSANAASYHRAESAVGFGVGVRY